MLDAHPVASCLIRHHMLISHGLNETGFSRFSIIVESFFFFMIGSRAWTRFTRKDVQWLM